MLIRLKPSSWRSHLQRLTQIRYCSHWQWSKIKWNTFKVAQVLLIKQTRHRHSHHHICALTLFSVLTSQSCVNTLATWNWNHLATLDFCCLAPNLWIMKFPQLLPPTSILILLLNEYVNCLLLLKLLFRTNRASLCFFIIQYSCINTQFVRRF